MSRITFGVTHDDMVEQINPENVGCLPELAGLCEATDYGNWTTARRTRRA